MHTDSMLYRRQSNKSLINFRYKKRAVVHTALIQEYSGFSFARRGIKWREHSNAKNPFMRFYCKANRIKPFVVFNGHFLTAVLCLKENNHLPCLRSKCSGVAATTILQNFNENSLNAVVDYRKLDLGAREPTKDH